MRKIINGKTYDTETAKEVAILIRSCERDYFEETLFLKRTGEFFLYGEPGPLHIWLGDQAYAMAPYGRGITPLTVEEARKWAEEGMMPKAREALFGKVEE